MTETSLSFARITRANTPAAPLSGLAEAINASHLQANRAARQAVLCARSAGDLLIQAKAQVQHGKWIDWLQSNCPDLPARTASCYMRVARHWETLESKSATVADLTINQAMQLLSHDPQKEQAVDDAFASINSRLEKIEDHAQKAIDSHRALLEVAEQFGAWREHAASFGQYLAQIGMPAAPRPGSDDFWAWMNGASEARARLLADMQGRERQS